MSAPATDCSFCTQHDLVNRGRAGCRCAEGRPAPCDDRDPNEVFTQFKHGLEKQLSAEDADSHLHLAIAYREMALYGDAVREAAVAFRATRDRKKADEAMWLLLSPPLLKPDGVEALRARLRMN